jgi:hypothetical protein
MVFRVVKDTPRQLWLHQVPGDGIELNLLNALNAPQIHLEVFRGS